MGEYSDEVGAGETGVHLCCIIHLTIFHNKNTFKELSTDFEYKDKLGRP